MSEYCDCTTDNGYSSCCTRLATTTEALREAVDRHYQTGDYVALGIAAHDAYLALERTASEQTGETT